MEQVINHTKTILLIDDDADDCLILSQALATVSNSISLSYIQNADQLFNAIEINKPSLIFIDFHMPKRSGLDLLRQIKSHPDYKDIPVVMWSTSLLPDNVMAAHKEVVQAFVQKPCCYKKLETEVREILLLNKIEVSHFTDTYN